MRNDTGSQARGSAPDSPTLTHTHTHTPLGHISPGLALQKSQPMMRGRASRELGAGPDRNTGTHSQSHSHTHFLQCNHCLQPGRPSLGSTVIKDGPVSPRCVSPSTTRSWKEM